MKNANSNLNEGQKTISGELGYEDGVTGWDNSETHHAVQLCLLIPDVL